MKPTWNEIAINRARQKTLINHFIRELFGNSALRDPVAEYTPEEYLDAIESLTGPDCSSLNNSAESLAGVYPLQADILLSFLRLHALQILNDREVVPIKNHLANYLAHNAMLRVSFAEDIESLFRNKS